MRFVRCFVLSVILLSIGFAGSGGGLAAATTHSVLSTGKWVKISVPQSGIYKLEYADIVRMGINPSKVQVYGYGGKMLSENFALNDYVDDLPVVPIYKSLGKDGVFNAGDFILFYAQGPIWWYYDSYNSVYRHARNPYSDKGFYLVGEREAGSQTVSVVQAAGTPTVQVKAFTDFQVHETETVNMGESVAGKGTGRELYGEDFIAQNSRTFSFETPDPDSTGLSKVFTEMAVHASVSTMASMFVDNQYVNSLYFLPVAVSESNIYGYEYAVYGAFYANSATTRVTLEYQPSAINTTTRAFLNYIDLNVRRNLKMAGATLMFRDPVSVRSGAIARFEISNVQDSLLLFDVTQPGAMVRLNGTSENGRFYFQNSASSLKEYVAVNVSGSVPKPTIEGSIPVQDLHAQSGMDMVIVSPAEFLPQAIRLARTHAEYDNLQSLIVTPEQVYHEFSSGTPDATAIRRMMKWYYEHPGTDNVKPRHLLLFGDGVYDNRLATSVMKKKAVRQNKILTYQSSESLDGYNSFVTDDYFGFLDNDEGSNLRSAQLDIGIGRFPVATVDEAKIAVDKTIAYIQNLKKGAWKNRLMFLADNGDTYMHEIQSDTIANMLNRTHPEFMIDKVFLDTYTPVTTATGTTMPDANAQFAKTLDAGMLLLNYSGHGSTTQWAEEKLLVNADIERMNNACLPLWITATCDFTRYDDSEKSGGELVFLKENGGGIALVTTSRIVFATNNKIMNKSFMENVFKRKHGARMTLGETMIEAKRCDDLVGDANKLSFTLIGDPALKLAYPEYSARITALNEKPVGGLVDTLRALSRVTVSGKVYRPDGSFADDFNGVLVPTVLDAPRLVAKYLVDVADTFSIVNRNNVLFSGRDSIVNGEFRFSFVMPLDNSYSYKQGRINLYAFQNEDNTEAQGSFDGFVIGGTDVTAPKDEQGPTVRVYLNNESFVGGGTVGNSPTFIARLNDASGLNTSGNGVGHNLTLTVDGDSKQTYTLNTSYLADLGSYQSGYVRYQLPELSEGNHQLEFRAWDVQNNATTVSLPFVVKNGVKPSVYNLRFVQSGGVGRFWFDHDRPTASIRIRMDIYDISGRLVWRTDEQMRTEGNAGDVLLWNLTDQNKRSVSKGLYICKVTLTDSNGIQQFCSEKISVSGQ